MQSLANNNVTHANTYVCTYVNTRNKGHQRMVATNTFRLCNCQTMQNCNKSFSRLQHLHSIIQQQYQQRFFGFTTRAMKNHHSKRCDYYNFVVADLNKIATIFVASSNSHRHSYVVQRAAQIFIETRKS